MKDFQSFPSSNLLSQTSKFSLQLAFMLDVRSQEITNFPSNATSRSFLLPFVLNKHDRARSEKRIGLSSAVRHSFPPIFLKPTGPPSVYWPHCNSDRTI